MPTDLTIILDNRPGTIAAAGEALGGAGVNIEGTCGFPCGGEGILHVLVEDAGTARQAAEDAGFEVRDERDVVVVDIDDQPGALGELTRRIADQGVNVDLVYLATATRVVLGGDDVEGIRGAI
ncbi:MAG: amino acid-binding protein [Actinobacteria bacterium]|nr:amino acid-binding protein [Actinomycetota bacterium]